ncbi:protein FAM83G [Trichomycterus rosablanca]|uniref:protein FAM83G n=1 Tax=Trichomycterus rosablanca TaxID=2290929 RepID=UPI002F3577F3
MALSQIQCLDDNHVNWRINETKIEFLYSEEQRLAVESLISGGRDAFGTYIKERELRPFLSERELERLGSSVEDYRPGAEPPRPDLADGDERPLSLQYWPDRSDTSIPDLDLGWPDYNSYRGVTRVNVYTQPPMGGQTHIKEVVRKAIVQAQKIIAIVMDVFTDVDIFKDLLDAGFKRKVAVYIIIEQSSIQDFLHMCERATMHGGHLKYLRVRCIGGSVFHTRSAKRVQGSLNQKFMFVDGDRAISGSYSFTWTAARLDRNLITVLTGQAVEAFDKQFCELYLTSQSVNLSKVPLTNVPEPEPLPVPAPAAVPTPAIARKLINPKYSLVDTASKGSSDKASPKNSNSQNALPVPVKQRRRNLIEELPKHPGLVGLPKAELIPYLPTWPEPDPPSDVIGFINIRDTSKPLQPHLMRSQMFEASQAIRFKDPFIAPPEEPLPEKACPRRNSGNTPKTNPLNSYVREAAAPVETPAENESPTGEPPAPVQARNPVAEVTAPKPVQTDVDAAPPGPPVPKPRTVQLAVTVPDDPAVQNSKEYQEAEQNLDDRDHAGQDESPENDTDSTRSVELADPTEIEARSTASDEYYECSDSDRIANGKLGGSSHLGKPGSLNVMSRLSQSLVDLRLENGLEPDPAQRNALNVPDRAAVQTIQQNSRFPVPEVNNRTNRVVIAKPGAFHLPTKKSAHVIGGHRYWNDRLNMPPPDDPRLGRLNCRRNPPDSLNPSAVYRVSDARSPSPRGRVETHTPLGISVSKLAGLGNFRNKMPMVTSTRKVTYGQKKS